MQFDSDREIASENEAQTATALLLQSKATKSIPTLLNSSQIVTLTLSIPYFQFRLQKQTYEDVWSMRQTERPNTKW